MPRGGRCPFEPHRGAKHFFEKTNVRFEFSTLKLVYKQIFCQIGQVEQYDPRGGASPL